MAPTTRRQYTAQELNQLLIETRLPTMEHHPAVQLLMCMAVFLEAAYTLRVPEDDENEDWLSKVVETFQEQVLRGTAAVLTEGVLVEHATAPTSKAVN